ncbi:MAG TPA: excinuclease ABC subunit UvrC [Candidatus Humimicrobiaceae bacterium]
MEVNENLKHTLSILPRKPGVYLFKDVKGRIIYVGKAKSLFDRVKSYFMPNDNANYINHPITFFTSKIDSVDFIETDNEVEALILESSLIKKNRPKYNFNLKDDKSYPYVAVTDNEKFPRVFITRNKNIRGAKYYGPYINIKNTRNTLETLRRIFQVRDCRKPKPGKVKNAVCLNYHINLCSAPCTGRISEKAYRQNIEYIKLFLKRGENAIVDNLKSEMASFASRQEFEEAAKVKYAIEAIEEMLTAQRISFASYDTWDILGAARDTKSNLAAVSLYNYREGELAAVNNFIISNVMLVDEKEIISGFLKSYYLEIDNISPVIYIPFAIEDAEAISKWLSDLKGKKIEIKAVRQDDKKNIVRMAAKNAFLYLEKKKFEKSSGYSRAFKELLRLKEAIGLANIPSRIECFDISNIGPSFAVGSMSVFTNASPLNSNYRHFKIRAVEGQDDFAMIAEVVSRRLNYLSESTVDIEDSFYMKPQLIIIDGGKAQYNAAKKVFEEKNIDDIDLISIAKKEEIIFSENHPDGLSLDRHSDYMKIIIRIRDEAHRFAINYHKKLRSEYMTRSVLDGIKGIGEKKKALVLEKFEDIEDLKACKLDDFIKIKGLSYTDALNIYNSLNRY